MSEKAQVLPREGQECFKELSSKFYLVTDCASSLILKACCGPIQYI
jgi:hypothetical protein